MSRLFVCDDRGDITIDVDVCGPILHEALEAEQAEPLVRCAVLMALSTLVEGGQWPAAALDSMVAFMTAMRTQVTGARLT